MDFVAKNTNIPVPHILSVFTAKGEVHIVMEYIRTALLRDCWRIMSWEQRKSIVVQLRDFILQLRALTPLHPGKIHAAGGVEFGLYDPREQNKPFASFETVDQFHEFTGVNYLRQHIDQYSAFQSAFEKCAQRTYSIKFSHGDLAPHNIMVQDGKVLYYRLGMRRMVSKVLGVYKLLSQQRFVYKFLGHDERGDGTLSR
jgi:aminoglycoside phosphotransferase (APT) family kinase protein